jgi:hypothetical protein
MLEQIFQLFYFELYELSLIIEYEFRIPSTTTEFSALHTLIELQTHPAKTTFAKNRISKSITNRKIHTIFHIPTQALRP